MVNQAVVSYTEPGGAVITNDSDDPDDATDADDLDTEPYNDPDDPTHTDLSQYWLQWMAVNKTDEFIDLNNDGMASAGEIIRYAIEIINTGNVALHNLQITDDLITNSGATLDYQSGDINTNGILDVGETWYYQADYVLTQDDFDVNCGHICNQAIVDYEDPAGTAFNNYSDDPNDPSDIDNASDNDPLNDADDPTCMDIPVVADIALIKSDNFDDSDCTQLEQEIVYTFEVSNTGNTSLHGVVITDDILTNLNIDVNYVSGDTDGDNELDVDEVWIYLATYPVTQADIDAGHFDNQATVATSNNCGNDAVDISDPSDVNQDNVTVTDMVQCPEITLLKEGEFNDENGNGLAEIGETITYTFTVANTGNVTLHDITIDDPIVAVTGGILPVLPVGQTDTTTFTAVYVITKADIERGFVTNQATATGFDPNNDPVTDISDDPDTPEEDDATIVTTVGVVIPDIFTPNDDGVNDTFVIAGLSQFEHPAIKIYNRWGNLVYDADPYPNDWDGTSEGGMILDKAKRLPTGTYFYILELGEGYAPISGWVYLDR